MNTKQLVLNRDVLLIAATLKKSHFVFLLFILAELGTFSSPAEALPIKRSLSGLRPLIPYICFVPNGGVQQHLRKPNMSFPSDTGGSL
jgi:hypothetical protein